jgi:hypothetical protein
LAQYAVPFALKFYVPYALQDKLQGKLTIGRLGWNLLGSSVDAGNIVFTPNNAQKPLVQIKNAHVAFEKLWANPVVIDRILFEGVQGTIARNADGNLNANSTLENLRASKSAEQPTTVATNGLKVAVKTFELRDVVVQNFVGSTDPAKPLNEIKLQTALVENIGTADKPLLLKNLPRELLAWVLRQQMQALPALAVDGMVGKAKKALDSVGDALKGLFGN